ncbi:hypothetical protein HJG60_010075 [Phyllostomus discolor]|uniref:Uncharacterized protein n=1 Tax=Phyllostomus discolor TaxID=89673 RepID=A0A834B1X9_9CHIR|nr:hypothetical protein HJG60_010075 [Phyllostomus discolor]
MRTPSPRLGWHPSLASLGEVYPPGAAARPGEPQEEGFDLVRATSPKKGAREAPRLNLGPAARLPVLRHHPGLRPAQPPGRGGMLGTWKRWGARGARTELGAHPAYQGCLRWWANRGPRMELGPGPAEQEATCRPLNPWALGLIL